MTAPFSMFYIYTAKISNIDLIPTQRNTINNTIYDTKNIKVINGKTNLCKIYCLNMLVKENLIMLIDIRAKVRAVQFNICVQHVFLDDFYLFYVEICL